MKNEEDAALISRGYKWYMLIILWGAFFLNQGDRQLFNNVLPLIEKDLGFSPVQLGLVATIFTICYGIFVPIAGYAGDKIQKRLVVFLSLLIFSSGTLLTGLVPHPASEALAGFLPGGAQGVFTAATLSLGLLIAIRSVATGIGEAFYYPAANSLIDLYHGRTRASAMAIHQTANYTGVVFGGTLSAWVGYTYGWRNAFFVFGVIGVIWAILLFFVFRNDWKDAAILRPEANGNARPTVALGEALRSILTRPTFYLLSAAFGGMCFVNVGFLTWMPKYLIEHFQVPGTMAGFNATFYHHLLAYGSVFVAAGLSDYFANRFRTIRIQMELIGLLGGAPFIWWMGASENLLFVYIALAGFGLFRGIYDSNLFVAMFDVIEPKYRSTASGLMLSAAFVIGSFSPVILAAFARRLDNNFGPGLSALSAVYLLSAGLVLIAILFFYRRDRAAAERTNAKGTDE